MKNLKSNRPNIPIGERGILVDLFFDVLDTRGGIQYSRGAGAKVAEHVIALFLVVEDVLHFEIAMTNRSLTMMQTRHGHADVAKYVQHLVLSGKEDREGKLEVNDRRKARGETRKEGEKMQRKEQRRKRMIRG